MQKKMLFFIAIGMLVITAGAWGEKEILKLPPVKTTGTMSVEEAISQRRSRRNFSAQALNREQLSQVLWSAQGITNKRGFRTVPSAGATFPLTLYAVIGAVRDIPAGVYRYNPEGHYLQMSLAGDIRKKLASTALGQGMISAAPVTLVITAKYSRITPKYRERGIRYAHIETGHIGQNIYLQCQSLGLGTCAVGAFNDKGVKELLDIKEVPLYIMPVGIPK